MFYLLIQFYMVPEGDLYKNKQISWVTPPKMYLFGDLFHKTNKILRNNYWIYKKRKV